VQVKEVIENDSQHRAILSENLRVNTFFYKKNLSKTITFLLFTYTIFYIKIETKEKLGWKKKQSFRQN